MVELDHHIIMLYLSEQWEVSDGRAGPPYQHSHYAIPFKAMRSQWMVELDHHINTIIMLYLSGQWEVSDGRAGPPYQHNNYAIPFRAMRSQWWQSWTTISTQSLCYTFQSNEKSVMVELDHHINTIIMLYVFRAMRCRNGRAGPPYQHNHYAIRFRVMRSQWW